MSRFISNDEESISKYFKDVRNRDIVNRRPRD